MAFEESIANAFNLDDENWLRHANPASVWSRAAVLPILAAGIWSRVWIGWWSVAIVVVGLLWMWLNPRAFDAPESTDNWASKSVLGERVWMNRDEVEVPEHHRFLPHFLNAINGLVTLVLAWGLYQMAIWPTLLGVFGQYAMKFWFLDRMVWLYEEMHLRHEPYAEWLY
jgi:hypothetical protein